MNKLIKITTISLLALGIYKLLLFATDNHTADLNFLKEFNERYNVYSLIMPDDITFANEPVPYDDPEVYERYDRELLSNTYFQSQGLLYFKRAHKYFPLLEKILKEQGVPEDFKFLALIESGLTNAMSPAGAAGPWQIMKETGINYGLIINGEVDERYHMEKSTVAACKYLKDAYKKFGSWTLAAASYNMGMGGINKQLNRQGVENYYDLLLNQETSRYVFRILAVKEIYNNPRKYGFNFRKVDLYKEVPTSRLKIDTAIANLAEFSENQGITYKLLKYYNPWLRENYLNNTEKNTYYFKVPKKGYHHIMTDLKGVMPHYIEEADSTNIMEENPVE